MLNPNNNLFYVMVIYLEKKKEKTMGNQSRKEMKLRFFNFINTKQIK